MSPNVLKTYTKKNIDLNDFVLFCRVDRQLSKVTTKDYRYRILRFLETVNKDPVKITKNDLRQYLRSIQNNYIKWQYTYADTLRAFKIYFRDYLDKGDLVDSFRFPKIPFYPKRVPSNVEVKMFYKSIGDIQGRTMYLLFASSGLRRSELLSLHDGNIDVERNMVTSRIHSGSTKNSWCTFFNNECKDVLLEYLEIRNHNRSKLFPWNSRKHGKVFWK